MDAPWTRSRSRTGALCPAISPPPSTSLRAFPVTSQAHRGPSSSALLAAVNDSWRWSRQVRGRYRDAIPATPRPRTSALHPAGPPCFRQCRTQAGIGRGVGDPIDRPCRAHPQRAGERRAALGRERAGPKARARPGNRPWPVAGAPGSRLCRAGSQLGQIPARRRPAATRHLLPRPHELRARSLVHAERLAVPSRCRRARRCDAMARA
jgi:hypothetical protein